MSITSANSVLYLTIPSIFPTPQRIQGYATDDVYDAAAQAVTETMIGIDGGLSGGFVNAPQEIGYSLQADSLSIAVFDTWWLTMKQQQETYPAYGSIQLPGLKMLYTLTKGFLKDYPAIPSAAKTLKPRKFTIVWQSVVPSPTP